MAGFLEIAIFLFATSIHNGQALVHWARAIARLARHVRRWIEFWNWIGVTWQTYMAAIYIDINSRVFVPAFCLSCHVPSCRCLLKTCNKRQLHEFRKHLFAPLCLSLKHFFSLTRTNHWHVLCLNYLITTIMPFCLFLNAFSMCSSANQFFSFILGQVCRKQLSSILDSALELTLTRLVIPCGWLIVLFFWWGPLHVRLDRINVEFLWPRVRPSKWYHL